MIKKNVCLLILSCIFKLGRNNFDGDFSTDWNVVFPLQLPFYPSQGYDATLLTREQHP
ncbi:hypothetical protein V6Z11_D03G140100 [Gossypium hirsutum]